MSLNDSSESNDEAEISVGWSSLTGEKYSDDPQSIDSNGATSPPDRSQINNSFHFNVMNGLLGKYSSLVPGSSPPAPPPKETGKRKLIASPRSPKHRVNKKRAPIIPNFEDLLSSDPDFEDLPQLQQLEFKPSYFSNRKVRRFVVQRIELRDQDLYLVCTDSKKIDVDILLRDSWRDTVVGRGDVIHLISLSGGGNHQSTTLDDKSDLFLVVNPDILVNCTAVAESLSCERQVVLKNRVRGPSDLNIHMVLGSIKHQMIQLSFEQNSIEDTQQMKQNLIYSAKKNAIDLKLLGVEVNEAVSKLESLIPNIQAWAKTIWGPQSNGRTSETVRGNETMKIQIKRAVLIEEEVRSPHWGLLGRVDVTTEGTNMLDNKAGNRLIALEIKTGRSSVKTSNYAQAMLYIILLSERHPYNTHPWSILYYTEDGNTVIVSLVVSELRAMIQKRNSAARDIWMDSIQNLPIPYSASDAICNWCNLKNSCALFTAIQDRGNTHGISALESVYHKPLDAGILTPKFLEFIDHWTGLLDLEYEADNRYAVLQANQWWINELDPVLWGPQQELPHDSGGEFDHKNVYKMEQRSQSKPVININAGDRIVLSTKAHMGVTYGLCLNTFENEIDILTENRLIMTLNYRIDVDTISSNMFLSLAKFNLASLIDSDRLRELIVELREPKFMSIGNEKLDSLIVDCSGSILQSQFGSGSALSGSAPSGSAPSGNVPSHVTQTRTQVPAQVRKQPLSQDSTLQSMNLNADQRNAVSKVLSARDYALILGMPGTGKTTTISTIVSLLLKKRQTVLLTAHTNSAVDTLVSKLMAANIKCLRLANRHRDQVHPSVLPVTISVNNYEYNEDILSFLDCDVIACTSHTTNNKFFALRSFDVCILDEASQILLPFSLGPLRLAKRFVLVGDHYQLSPLVKNAVAKKNGLDQSLFKILCDAHPEAVAHLTIQYRMCSNISEMSSELVYDGKLVCGNESIANQKFHLPKIENLSIKNSAVLNPENTVIFIDTDCMGQRANEFEMDDGVSNPFEAELIKSLVESFDKAGAALEEIAIISLYRRQLSHLENLMSASVEKGLEIITADQAQGRDRPCIVVSLVRSNNELRVGNLLNDWRRLNVAFTRAMQKLVIVGSSKMMLNADESISKYYSFLENKGWVIDANKLE